MEVLEREKERVLDLSGLMCPLPIVITSENIKRLKEGEVITVISTDPGFERDIFNWCKQTGNQLLSLKVALVNYFYSLKLRRLNDYIDFVFLIPLALLSGEPLAIFFLLVPSLFGFPKNLVPFFISVLSATALGVYNFGLKGLLVFPLTLALGISPSYVELLRSLQKDRRYFFGTEEGIQKPSEGTFST
jgi:TusA-related sulfurtransferase